VYLGSADWMPRNFFRRVEAIFPIEDPELRRRIIEEVLPTELRDNEDARELQPDGTYIPPKRAAGEESFSAQKYFMALAIARVTAPGTTPLVAPAAPVSPPAPSAQPAA
jgi:polyphosphate kinase